MPPRFFLRAEARLHLSRLLVGLIIKESELGRIDADTFATANLLDANGELLWLLGQPHLADYLSFVKHKVIGGDQADPSALAEEWRAANDYYHELESVEAGLADTAEILPLDPVLGPLADALRDHAWYRTTFDTLPAEVAMVELDKLVVSQTHVANLFSELRARSLGPTPEPQALFHFCLPLDRENPPVRIERLAADRWLFSSTSTDLRAHEPAPMNADQLAAFASFGPVSGGIGLLVGFGCNFMSVIRSDDRMVLHNGYHRACALRALGITHAPAIVQSVTRKDELRIAANEAVLEDPAFYFLAARPPLLKDFFDPRIAKKLAVRPIETRVEVEFKLKSFTATQWGNS
jgi:hypothetical protein